MSVGRGGLGLSYCGAGRERANLLEAERAASQDTAKYAERGELWAKLLRS